MIKSKSQPRLALAADIELLASSISAGLPMDQATDYLARHGSAEYGGIWKKLNLRLDAGLPLHLALHDFKVSASDRWVDQFCEIVITCDVYRSSLLAAELGRLAQQVRQVGEAEIDVSRRIASAKSVALLALAAPWILLLMLLGKAENREVFLRPEGLGILSIGVFASVLALFLSSRIALVPEQHRVFA
jgi:tight adherence protein B